MLERVATDRTAKQDREDAREWVSRLIASIPQDAGVSYSAMARSLTINHQRVSKMADVNYPTVNVTVADVVCLPPVARVVIVRALAELCGCTLVANPDMDSPNEDLRMIADAHRETAETIALALASCADGRVSVDEAVAIKREAKQGMAALARIYEWAKRTIDSRGTVLAR